MKKSPYHRQVMQRFCKFFVFCFCLILFSEGTAMAQESRSLFNLNQLVDSALQNNFLLKANDKNTLIKQAEIDILRTNYQPEISTSLSASMWRFLLPNKERLLGNTLSDVYTDITFSQILYDWGEQDIKKAVIEQEIVLNDDIRRQIRNTIIWGVTDTYFEVLKAQSEVETYHNSIMQLKSHLQYAQSLYDIGKVSGVDILKTEVQISVEEKALRKAENSITSQLAKLKRLSYLAGEELPILDDLSEVYFSKWESRPLRYDSIYLAALTNHPILMSSETKKSLEAKQKELYRLQNRPELYSFGIASWEHGYFPFGNNFNYNIGATLRYTIPYWRGSDFKTKIRQSDIRISQIEDEKAQSVNDIKQEIDIALSEIADNREEIENNLKIMRLSRETVDNASVVYQSGLGAIIDVLDAQAILTESTIAYKKSKLVFLQSVAKLNYLTGNDNYPF